jgi:8-oxo-dGTP pyrophosphatase MutT (NUDIX family)
MKYLLTFENLRCGNIGAGIIPFCEKTKRFLLGLRSGYVLEPNTYGGFGGKLDIDEGVYETIEMAAKRELEEETGFNGDIELIKGFIFKERNFEYHNYIGVVSEEFQPVLNWENDESRWMTYDELLRLRPKHFGLDRFLKESKEIFEKLAKPQINLSFDEDF